MKAYIFAFEGLEEKVLVVATGCNQLARIIDGYVIVRVVRRLTSRGTCDVALESVEDLAGLVEQLRFAQHICPHTNWAAWYDSILPEHMEERGSDALNRHTCLWSHGVSCSAPECKWTSPRPGCVYSCEHCFTGFGLAKCDMPDGGERAVELWTWHDLGNGKKPDDVRWMSQYYTRKTGVRGNTSTESPKDRFERVMGGRIFDVGRYRCLIRCDWQSFGGEFALHYSVEVESLSKSSRQIEWTGTQQTRKRLYTSPHPSSVLKKDGLGGKPV